VVIGNGNPLIL